MNEELTLKAREKKDEESTEEFQVELSHIGAFFAYIILSPIAILASALYLFQLPGIVSGIVFGMVLIVVVVIPVVLGIIFYRKKLQGKRISLKKVSKKREKERKKEEEIKKEKQL
jgi:uncharacterized membrane protein